ncbi:MAG: hypothetical protein KGL53_17135, partial [Elusimicrobia bacterium]|nr:hypothetical protein [Elusimicrobiota bacterium]
MYRKFLSILLSASLLPWPQSPWASPAAADETKDQPIQLAQVPAGTVSAAPARPASAPPLATTAASLEDLWKGLTAEGLRAEDLDPLASRLKDAQAAL